MKTYQVSHLNKAMISQHFPTILMLLLLVMLILHVPIREILQKTCLKVEKIQKLIKKTCHQFILKSRIHLFLIV